MKTFTDNILKEMVKSDVILITSKELGKQIFEQGRKSENCVNEYDDNYASELVLAFAERIRERISTMVNATIQTHYHSMKGQGKKSILHDIQNNVQNFEII